MISDIFKTLLSNNGRLFKEKIMEDNADNSLFKEVCYLALNPYIKFYIRKIPKYTENRGTRSLEDTLPMLKKFSDREISGHAGVAYLKEMFESLSAEDASVLKKIIDKDLKCGVSRSTVNKTWEGLIPRFDVQAAIQYDERKIPASFRAEPKLDGMRITVLCDHDGDISFMTRGGKEVETLDHLKDDLIALNGGKFNFMFDLETISGGFQNTMSVVKRLGKNKKQEDIYLWIFDHMTYDQFKSESCPFVYEERRVQLEKLFETNKSEFLVLNESVPFEGTRAEAKEWIQNEFARRRAQKFEGLIIKDLKGTYDFDRTASWMKVKPSDTVDVEITGYYLGSKGTKNEHRLGGFTFMYDGVESRVGGGFSDPQRDEFWEKRDEMVGAIIEVEFMEKTDKGATRHCNFITVRSFKGEKA